MSNYATKEGTTKYKSFIIRDLNIPSIHFREFLDLQLSSIGMGTYLGYPNSETDELVRNAVLESIKGGINVIDTAINYRMQRAERSVGRAIKLLPKLGFTRDQIFISSKIGYIPGDGDLSIDGRNYITDIVLKDNLATPNEIIGMNCMSIPYLEHQLNQSLNNLGIETLDLLYLHNLAEAEKPELGEDLFYQKLDDCFRFLEEKVDEGKIKNYGLATWDSFRVTSDSPEYLNLRRVVKIANRVVEINGKKQSHFKFIMIPFNYLLTEAATLKNQDGSSFFEKAKEFKIGIFGAVPIMQARALDHPKLREIKQSFDVKTPAQAALQFARSYGLPLIAPLIGHKNPSHIKENLDLILKKL